MSPARRSISTTSPEPAGTLHAGLGLSTVAHATIRSIDLSAVRAAPASSTC
jgi:xanthine dehydrogenase large subunit